MKPEPGQPQLVPVGDGHYICDTPSERFPIYTRGNAGEVYPEVFYPLSWSISAAEGDAAFRNSMLAGRGIRKSDLTEDAALASGVFNGYAYLNLSVVRIIAVRMPSATMEDVDSTFMGSSEAPPYEPHPDDKNWRASLGSLRAAWQAIRTTDLPELVVAKRRVKAWTNALPAVDAPTDELIAYLEAEQLFLYELFEQHLIISGRSALALGALQAMCRDELDDEPLALALISGLGDVESATPSQGLWDLGRTVAASTELTAIFDAGLDGLEERLRAGVDTAAFLAEFDEFLAENGCRGPNEWETACATWGTDHSLPLALVDRMRGADADHEPALQIARLAKDSEARSREALAQLRGPKRWLFRQALTSARVFAAGRERSKTTVIKAIHEVRLRTITVAQRLAAETPDGQPDDLWFLLRHELPDYRADPAGMAQLIAERRAMRDTLSKLEPPFIFKGQIPPIEEWTPRDARKAEVTAAALGETLSGIAGCTGKATGRAVVVTDPSQPGDLGPGDVLVAPFTDPSWTPLFVPADAVIVDVGAAMSHAVIVSRELGIPCVVSVTDATRRIPDGALVEVDGTNGTVTILELPA